MGPPALAISGADLELGASASPPFCYTASSCACNRIIIILASFEIIRYFVRSESLKLCVCVYQWSGVRRKRCFCASAAAADMLASAPFVGCAHLRRRAATQHSLRAVRVRASAGVFNASPGPRQLIARTADARWTAAMPLASSATCVANRSVRRAFLLSFPGPAELALRAELLQSCNSALAQPRWHFRGLSAPSDSAELPASCCCGWLGRKRAALTPAR